MRKYYIDWLRIIGILLLFPFHTARIFDHWEWNYIKDTPNWFSSWFIVGTSFWFMPLLFFIAGYASWHALKKRSAGAYAKERVARLLIPFLFGLIFVVPIQGYYAMVQHFQYGGNYFEYLGKFFTDFSDLSGYNGTFTPAHLWFILFLFVISMALLPLLNRIKTNMQSGGMNSFVNYIKKPWFFLLLFIPLTISEALPDIGGKNPFFYGLIFLMGYLISAVDGIEKTIARLRLIAAVCVVPLSVFMIYLELSWDMPSDFSPQAIGVAFLRNLCLLLVLITLLGYGEKFLNRGDRVLTYLNQAAFPVYILHQSLMMVIAYYVVGTDAMPGVKYIAIMLLTLAASFAGFELFKRFRATRFVLGIKK